VSDVQSRLSGIASSSHGQAGGDGSQHLLELKSYIGNVQNDVRTLLSKAQASICYVCCIA
jgi:hypothetical protein